MAPEGQLAAPSARTTCSRYLEPPFALGEPDAALDTLSANASAQAVVSELECGLSLDLANAAPSAHGGSKRAF
jgi:hypothetical protein